MNFKITTRELDKLREERDDLISALDWHDELHKVQNVTVSEAESTRDAKHRERLVSNLQYVREDLKDKISTMQAGVDEALAAVNGRAKNFAITSWMEVKRVAEYAEIHLNDAGIPQALRRGTVVHYRPAGPVANSYKYAAASTGITLKRVTDGWRLVDIRKTTVYPKQAERLDITISPEARDAVIKNAMSPFTVAE